MPKVMLEMDNLTKDFGGLRALDHVTMVVHEGELLGLIGPNGAGKTTLFNSVIGIYRPTSGRVLLQGENVTGLKPHKLAEKGLSKTFQLVTLFDKSNVLENMLVACQMRSKIGFFEAVFDTAGSRNKSSEMLDQALKSLELVGMSHSKDELAANLPYGHRKLLQLAMALALHPKVLFLDEPASGMNVDEITSMMKLVKETQMRGVAIILIEHNIRVIRNYCDRVVVLDYGRKIAEGTPEEVSVNKDVIKAYLGEVEIVT
jgi:branched-chain amino acid transport system ATP-binding protein